MVDDQIYMLACIANVRGENQEEQVSLSNARHC